MPATPAWLGAAEAVLNRTIEASSEARALARALEGSVLRIEVTGFSNLHAGVRHGRLSLTRGDDAEAPAATLTGSPLALAKLARGGGGDGASVQVRGDAEVASAYRALFAAARPDFEEELARLIGDLPARRLAGVAREGAAWLRRAARTAAENVAEYLQEESRDLVNKAELEEFLRGVDAAREAADRVRARLERLERRLGDRS